MNRLWHHLRGHHVAVTWLVEESGSGWHYRCQCGKGWTR